MFHESVGWTTRRYIPEDGILHIHLFENLQSYEVLTEPKFKC
jgi:hypothetical protein